MGLFDKLFGKGNSNNNNLDFGKTSEMLEEDLYWKIVSIALKKSPNQDEQQQILVSELQKLPADEIIGFKLRTDQLLFDIYNSEMWCAAYIINGGCSDDGFEYFRSWVISRGKEVYYNSKMKPDYLTEELNDEIEDYEFEDFLYVANDAFTANTGKDIYDYIDDENFKFNEGQKTIEFTWQEENAYSLKAICPKLFEAKWN